MPGMILRQTNETSLRQGATSLKRIPTTHMTYDTSKPSEAQAARQKLEELTAAGKAVDITVRRERRTLSQNAYLWLILAWWGTQTGYTRDEAAAIYKDINADTYRRTTGIDGREVTYMRHTYELDTAEMAATIDKFRHWAAMNEACPVYIPAPGEDDKLTWIRGEVQAARQYL